MVDLVNLARMSVVSAPGTGGSVALDVAVPGYLTFTQAGAVDGRTYRYGIRDGINREISSGVWTAATKTFTRTVLWSTNGNAAIAATINAVVGGVIAAEDIGSGGFYYQDTAPTSPKAGERWYDSLNGRLLVYLNDGSSSQWVGIGEASLPAPVANGRNILRNTSFAVAQRGVTGPATTTYAYGLDGWMVKSAGASGTWSRGSVTGSGYALALTGATSVTGMTCKQRVRDDLCANLISVSITFQARVYNGTGGSITPTLTVRHAGAANDWTSPVADVTAQALQVCPNAAFTTVSYTFTSHANSVFGLEFELDFGNNFSTTGKLVMIDKADARASATVDTPEVKTISADKQECGEYFYRRSKLTTAGQGDPVGALSAYNITGSIWGVLLEFPVDLWRAPVVSQSGGTDIQVFSNQSGTFKNFSPAPSWAVSSPHAISTNGEVVSGATTFAGEFLILVLVAAAAPGAAWIQASAEL